MTITNITTPEIDIVKLREVATDLLDAMVHGDTSPFKDMKEVLEDYLAAAPDLDATQRAGIFADALKGMYKDINSQVLSTAVEVLKNNSMFELEKYKTQATYNQFLANIPKTEEETKLVAAQVLKAQKETEILGEDKVIKEAQLIEMRAKLKKQYGVVEQVTMQLSDNVGDTFKQFTDGIWYKVNVDGNFVDAGGLVTTTPNVDGVPAVVSNLSISSTLENTVKPGALDKQILGYDMVNLKDVLKTMDERTALMQNAKIPETAGEKKMRKELLEAITNATIGLDADSNILTVSDIVVG